MYSHTYSTGWQHITSAATVICCHHRVIYMYFYGCYPVLHVCKYLYCSTYGNAHARKLCTCLTAACMCAWTLATEAKTSRKYHHFQVKFYEMKGPATIMRSHRNRKCSLMGENWKGNWGKMLHFIEHIKCTGGNEVSSAELWRSVYKGRSSYSESDWTLALIGAYLQGKLSALPIGSWPRVPFGRIPVTFAANYLLFFTRLHGIWSKKCRHTFLPASWRNNFFWNFKDV